MKSATIEPLEARIAPAAVFSFQDVDGDRVTVNISKGTLADLNGLFTYSAPFGHPRQIQEINLAGAAHPQLFAGANITISVVPGNIPAVDLTPAMHGDGFTSVGFINATGIDLGTVTIHGDLGKITAGDGMSKTDGLKGLTVQSLGAFGAATGAPDLRSKIDGQVDALVIKGNVDSASMDVVDSGGGHRNNIGALTVGGSIIGLGSSGEGEISAGNIGAIKIGGDLQGGTGPTDGSILASGNVASVTIGGSVNGGSNINTGLIEIGGTVGAVKIGRDLRGGVGASVSFSGRVTAAKIGSISIGGSLLGGSGTATGDIFTSSDMGPVTILGDVQGGAGSDSGKILSGGKLASLTIGGSLLGGGGSEHPFPNDDGQIHSTLSLGAVKIGGNVTGGAGSESAEIYAIGGIGSVTVGGSLNGGSVADTADIVSANDIGSVTIAGNLLSAGFREGGIYSSGKIGSITVGGSISGPGNQVVIDAEGKFLPKSQADAVALGKLTVGGSVVNVQIVVGYNLLGNPANADASIGSVNVAGNWVGSDLLASVADGGDGYFGHVGGSFDDHPIAGGNAAVLAEIASITIGGQLLGTPATAGDSHAFAAQIIGSLNLGGSPIPLPGIYNNYTFTDPNLDDVTVEEL